MSPFAWFVRRQATGNAVSMINATIQSAQLDEMLIFIEVPTGRIPGSWEFTSCFLGYI